MTNTLLIYPMFAMVLVTLAVLVCMLRARISAVSSGKIDIRHFKTYNSGSPTEDMIKTERHFSNLFELPVLFYAGCLVAMNLPLVGFWILLWPWLFVFARIAHAIIHIGPNKVRPRMMAYVLGWTAVLALWFHIVIVITLNLLTANA